MGAGDSGKDVLAGSNVSLANNPYNQANNAQITAEYNSGGTSANPNLGERWETEQLQNLPYPNAPHDGGPQDQANTQYITQAAEKANNIDYAISTAPTLVDKLGMIAGMAGVAAVGGAVIAPLAAGAAVGAGATAGGLAAGVAGGVAGGAFTGAVDSALTGQNIGKGALTGAAVGGIGAGASNLAQTAGLGSSVGNIAGKALGSLASNAINGNGSTSGTSGSTNTSTSGVAGAGLAVGALTSSGVQGNYGNMSSTMTGAGGYSTDSSLASTITGALPSVLQSAAGVYGSQNAAEKQTQADQNAILTQQNAMGNINSIWGTQQALGQGADTALGSALGTNGQPANYSNFENMPGYQFAVNQGTQAIQRQAASMGSAYTPNTAIAVGNYVTGTASQDYNTYISQLMGAAGLGTTANQGLQTGTQTTANNVSQLQQNQGQAQASGVMNSANSVAGGLSSAGGQSLIGAASGLLGLGKSATGAASGTPSAGSSGYNPDGSTDANAYSAYNTQSANALYGQNYTGDVSTLPTQSLDSVGYTPLNLGDMSDIGDDDLSFLGDF